MKILFLDVDGVLNSARFFKGRKWDEHVDRFETTLATNIDLWAAMIDPKAAELLEDLAVEAGDFSVVISSSWREVHTIARLKRIFYTAGMSIIEARIIDRTDIGRPRENAIRQWLNRFADEIEQWVVLDDMALNGLGDSLVKTTWADGLQQEHVNQLKRIFKGDS